MNNLKTYIKIPACARSDNYRMTTGLVDSIHGSVVEGSFRHDYYHCAQIKNKVYLCAFLCDKKTCSRFSPAAKHLSLSLIIHKNIPKATILIHLAACGLKFEPFKAMENSNKPTKKILTPSVVHNDLPAVKKPEHLKKMPENNDDTLPENPERNYHHEELKSVSSGHKEIRQADDDVWNGEDA